MSDWQDDIDGIKDLVDATGETSVTLPRYSKLAVEGKGVQLVPDPVNGTNRLRITGGPATAFTAEINANYTAQFGEHVLVASDEGLRRITLPFASDMRNGQVGVLNMAGALVQVAPDDGDTLNGSEDPFQMEQAGDSIICQSDGAFGWWIIARSTT